MFTGQFRVGSALGAHNGTESVGRIMTALIPDVMCRSVLALQFGRQMTNSELRDELKRLESDRIVNRAGLGWPFGNGNGLRGMGTGAVAIPQHHAKGMGLGSSLRIPE
jgi:hypothetical protein